jgi:DNA-binding NtrC family response regulator
MKQEREFRRQVIEHTLAAHRGIRTNAARALGIERTYLLRLMRELGIA